jgi:prepilin-type N-terminal cleavage/methylation domain-containing protein
MMATSRNRSRAYERGFTLVELLVATVAGVLVSMAAFLLSKNASRFFQHEARIASAQLAVTLGMNRITADLQRASFQSTPNIQADPMRCGAIATYPAGLQQLAGIQIRQNGSFADHGTQIQQSIDNGFSPDSIVIGGTIGTTEVFPLRTVTSGGGSLNLYLQTGSGPVTRTLNAATVTGSTVTDIFRAGRILRIVDKENHAEYGVIDGVDTTQLAAGMLIVRTRPNPAIPIKSNTQPCGISIGFETGALVSPVARVRYDLRSLLTDANYGALVAPAPGTPDAVTGDSGRTELVRVELDETGAEIATTLELVAEYAVDLKFGISTAAIPLAGNYTQASLIRYPMPSANAYTIAAPIAAGGTPQRITSVQVRLSTRSRAPDRQNDLPTNPGPDGRRTRFLLKPVPGTFNYARLRTLYADVALQNQGGVAW